MGASRVVPAAGIALTLAACGGREGTLSPTAELFAVNGASNAAVYPADTVTWAGFGFGSEPGPGVFVMSGGGGTAVEIVSWTDGAIRGILPPAVESGPTWVLTSADSLGPLGLVVRPRTAFEPGARTWTTDALLPVPLAEAAATSLRFPGTGGIASLVVVTGGRQPDGRLSDSTYLGVVSSEGHITEWRVARDTIVPPARRHHAMAGADRTNAALDVESAAYVIGGADTAGRVLADVFGIGVAGSGEYGLWTGLAALPDRRAGVAAIAAFGRLYAIGGFGSDSLASRAVAYAAVRPDGTLNGWFIGPSLPEGRAFAALAIAGGTLLAIGGERGIVGSDTPVDTAALAASVYAIPVSPLSGSFRDTTWTEVASALLHPRSRAAAFVVDDALVVTGGVYAGMPSAGETEYATLSGGVPATFQEFPGAPVAPQAGGPVWSAAAPVVWTAAGIARSTLIGGLGPSGPTAQVWSK
jgi:hypothetical protein